MSSKYIKLPEPEDESVHVTVYSASSKELEYLEEQETLSLFAALRRWPKIAWWSFALTSAIILWGFDSVLVGNVSSMPVFQEVYGEKFENKFIIPSQWLATWNVASPIGMMLGSVIGGAISDLIGRKKMLWISSAVSATAVAIFFFSDLPANADGKRGLFFLGKITQGLCIGALCSTTQTYMSETVPHQLRGPILAMFPIFQLIGQVIGSIIIQVQMNVNGRKSYQVCFATQWPIGLIPLVVSILLPESPAWLLRVGKVDQARKCHGRLEGSKEDPFAPASFATLQAAIAREHKEKSGIKEYLACFRDIDARRTAIVAFANLMPELFGISLCGNASYFLQTIGMGHSTSNLFFILGIVLSLCANISSLWSLTRFGRRALILWTLSPIVFIWLIMGIAGSFATKDGGIWTSAVSLALVVFVGSLGVWPASYVVSSEASSLRLRAKTQGIGWFVNGAFSCTTGIVLPYIYNNDAGNLGAKTAFVFVGTTAIEILTTWFLVPEMKGRSIQELDLMFESGLRTREFRSWKGQRVVEP